MHHIPLKKGWVFTEIEGVRDVEISSTYHLFDYEALPPIEIELDENFDWLKPYPEQISKEDWEYDFSQEIKQLKKDAEEKDLEIPNSFLNFMSNGELIRRIRSNTDCYFEFGDCIEEVVESNGMNFIHFMSDSQGCFFWYLCIDKDGESCIVTSVNLYGYKNKVAPELDEVGYFCASSFEEFIFRFWIENEIWYKESWENVELNDLEKKYVRFYKENQAKNK
jgi:hypothetical protein